MWKNDEWKILFLVQQREFVWRWQELVWESILHVSILEGEVSHEHQSSSVASTGGEQSDSSWETPSAFSQSQSSIQIHFPARWKKDCWNFYWSGICWIGASQPACGMVEHYITPRAARNKNLEWRFIINDSKEAELRQMVSTLLRLSCVM